LLPPSFVRGKKLNLFQKGRTSILCRRRESNLSTSSISSRASYES
jgi:hypothetical protein